MSTYDYRDPGTDPAYCDPLAPEPEETDPAMEAVGEIAFTLRKMLNEAESTLMDCDTPESVMALWRELRQASYRLDALANLAGVKADTF